MKKNQQTALLLATGAGVLWYLYRRQQAGPVAVVQPTAVDYINPASEHFVVNQVAKTVGIDLNAIGRKLGAGLYDLTH